MNKELEKVYNKMEFTQNIYLKSYMGTLIILDKQIEDTEIDELDMWTLDEFQLFLDLVNGRTII